MHRGETHRWRSMQRDSLFEMAYNPVVWSKYFLLVLLLVQLKVPNSAHCPRTSRPKTDSLLCMTPFIPFRPDFQVTSEIHSSSRATLLRYHVFSPDWLPSPPQILILRRRRITTPLSPELAPPRQGRVIYVRRMFDHPGKSGSSSTPDRT